MAESDQDLLDELDLGSERPPRRDTLERPRLQGRPPVEFSISYERDLTEADMSALALPRGARPKSLVRIHSSHHALARAVAAGMKVTQMAAVTGYDPGRISQLLIDPAFTALVADYKAEAKSVFADMAERMTSLSLDAIEKLHERLHDAPETFSPDTLLDIVKVLADRTGHGPNQEVHLKVDTDFIDRPPRETYEDWQARRASELSPKGLTDSGPTAPSKTIN